MFDLLRGVPYWLSPTVPFVCVCVCVCVCVWSYKDTYLEVDKVVYNEDALIITAFVRVFIFFLYA